MYGLCHTPCNLNTAVSFVAHQMDTPILTFSQYNILVQAIGQLEALIRLDPRVVINYMRVSHRPTPLGITTGGLTTTLDINVVLITMKPDILHHSQS